MLLDRNTNMATFAQIPESKLASFFRLNFMNTERVNKEFLYPASVQKFNPTLGDRGKNIFNYKKVSENSRIIPYTKAVSMGLKV